MFHLKAEYNKIIKTINRQVSSLQELMQAIKHQFKLQGKQLQITYKSQTGQRIQLIIDSQISNLKKPNKQVIIKVQISKDNFNSFFASNLHNQSMTSSASNMSEFRQLSSASKVSDKILGIDEKGQIHHNISCKMCKQESIIGVRWKCTVCKDYDLCNECYQKRKFQGHHKYSNHEFYKIQNKDFWATINYAKVIDLFFRLDENHKIDDFQFWLKQKDIKNDSQAFKNLIKQQGKFYEEFIDQNVQKWKEQFQNERKQNG